MYKRLMSVLLVLYSAQVSAVLDIEITGGVTGEHPIAVVPFSWEIPGAKKTTDVSKVLANNLKRTGRFALVPESSFRERPHHGGEVNFENWRPLGVESLIVGRVRPGKGGKYLIQFQLFDIFKKAEANDGGPGEEAFKVKQVLGYSLPSSKHELRRTAHYMSDLIYKALTGQRGVFTTRIAYITAKGAGKTRQYELQVADMDGYHPFTVLRSSQPIMSPAWSPDARQLAYVSFENKKSQIFIQNVDTGKRKLISAQKGVNSAPAWSPDGKKLALTLSRDSNLEIYTLDVRTLRLRRLTRNSAIDTEPSWSPDGKSIVFVSDRSGRPQIYRIAANGGRAERLTFDGNYNARPVYMPDGSHIALVHADDRGYHIATLDLQSRVLKVLTDGRLDESPSFAPNGGMILYAASERRRAILSGISVDGKVKQKLVLQQGDVREPAWAPYRK